MLNFLTNSTRPEAQLIVNQCAQFSADTELPHDQAVKCILKYIKGTSEQRLITNPDPEKVIECYIDPYLSGGWNQEESKDPYLVISIMVYVTS